MTFDELHAGINLYCEKDLSEDSVSSIISAFRHILNVETDTSPNCKEAVKYELGEIVDILINKGGISDSKGIQRALKGILELMFTGIKDEFIEFAMDLYEEDLSNE